MTEQLSKEYLMDLATRVKEYTLSKGVDAVEVYFNYEKRMEIVAENQSIGTERDRSELGFSVRVIINNAEGFSYSNKLDYDALTECADEAIGIAKVSPEKEEISLSHETEKLK